VRGRTRDAHWTAALALFVALALAPDAFAARTSAADVVWIHKQSDADDLRAIFQSQLEDAKKKKKHVVVMFTADWCTPCKSIKDFLDESKYVQKSVKKGRILIVDVDEWRGPAHALIPGVNPDKLPTLARVDYDGKLVQISMGTDLGLMSDKSTGDNLARLIDGRKPERPAYEDDPDLKRELIREYAQKSKERVGDLEPLSVEVLETRPMSGGLAMHRLHITVNNKDGRRRWFAFPSELGGALPTEVAPSGWDIVKFDEHVRAWYHHFKGADDFVVLPVAGQGTLDLEGWTLKGPAKGAKFEIFELDVFDIDGKKVQFDKKVPYALEVENADRRSVIRSVDPPRSVKLKVAKTLSAPLR
jgi:thiol-disulfide isomerase/thioredoxin